MTDRPTDRPTNQQTDNPGHGEVALAIMMREMHLFNSVVLEVDPGVGHETGTRHQAENHQSLKSKKGLTPYRQKSGRFLVEAKQKMILPSGFYSQKLSLLL